MAYLLIDLLKPKLNQTPTGYLHLLSESDLLPQEEEEEAGGINNKQLQVLA